MNKKTYRTLDEVETEYFTNNPDQIDPYIDEIFEEYAKDGDTASLLASLRIIAKVKGISNIANEIGITRQGLQKALSSKGNPRLENVNSIMQAMGYQLMPKKIDPHVDGVGGRH
jgi:probable addiction module antidote protein